MSVKHLMLAALCSATSTTAFAQHSNIMTLQGSADVSPVVNTSSGSNTPQSAKQYTVSGIVTAIQRKALGKDVRPGFFIQDPLGDNNPQTSDGIFVVSASHKVNLGDNVKVTGTVVEAYGWTQIRAAKIDTSGTTEQLKAQMLQSIASDEDFSQTLERHEGMLVTIGAGSKMLVSRTFGYDRQARRNNMAIAHRSINRQANQLFYPNSPQAREQHQSNQARNLTIESSQKAGKGEIPWYPKFAQANHAATAENYIRIGDRVNQLTGVLGYSHGQYRLYVTQEVTSDSFTHLNPRTNKPQLKQGDVTVATFNVLNYFNSPFGGDSNPSNKSRGAASKKEFEMQGNKIVKAIIALDADIIGLMEIENNGYGKKSALVDLLSRINKQLPTNEQYQFAQAKDSALIGTAAITNQVIYRPSSVSVAKVQIISMPQQHAPQVGKESGNNFMRDALTPTFIINKSGERLTISINHFKSKGSTCWEDVALQGNKDIDRQGSCENFRVSGAYYLGSQLAKIDGHKLIIGDLNSYALEDPISVLTHRDSLPTDYKITAARDTYIGGDQHTGTLLHGAKGAIIEKSFGYINTVQAKHPQAFGYSFSNVVGTLDYILASPSLSQHIVDAIEWNINSPESTLFEYPRKYTGKMNKYGDPYRSSDHDPVLISLKF